MKPRHPLGTRACARGADGETGRWSLDEQVKNLVVTHCRKWTLVASGLLHQAYPEPDRVEVARLMLNFCVRRGQILVRDRSDSLDDAIAVSTATRLT